MLFGQVFKFIFVVTCSICMHVISINFINLTNLIYSLYCCIEGIKSPINGITKVSILYLVFIEELGIQKNIDITCIICRLFFNHYGK